MRRSWLVTNFFLSLGIIKSLKVMNRRSITIHGFLGELTSFVSIAPSTMAKAKTSKIKYSNNKQFANLVDDWTSGIYDEDPVILAEEVSELL